VSLVVKLRALVLNVGKALRNASQTAASSVGPSTGNSVAGPTETPRATGFAPLTGTPELALPAVKWTPSPSVQQRQSFARQCTLQAVFDWYQGFLDSAAEGPDDNAANDPRQPAGRKTGPPPSVPGFPQFARQVIETEQDTVRVRFFYPGEREAGFLLLRPEATRCIIEVPDGPLYVARQAMVLPDLTRDLGDIPAAASPTGETESSLPRTGDHAHSPTPRAS
jgi:hypothetical protein